MPSIVRVKDWYAQSFEELVAFPKPQLPKSIAAKFPSNPASSPSATPSTSSSSDQEAEKGGGAREAAAAGSISKTIMDQATTNPVFHEMASLEDGAEEGEVAGRGAAGSAVSSNGNGNGTKKRVPLANR